MLESLRTLLRFWLIALMIIWGSLAKMEIKGPLEKRTLTYREKGAMNNIKKAFPDCIFIQ